LFFSRRRWATRVVKRAGFPSGSGEARVLIDLLMRASMENSKGLPTAEQVFFAALRLFTVRPLLLEWQKNLKSRHWRQNALSPSSPRQQLISPLSIECNNLLKWQNVFIYHSGRRGLRCQRSPRSSDEFGRSRYVCYESSNDWIADILAVCQRHSIALGVAADGGKGTSVVSGRRSGPNPVQMYRVQSW